MGTLKPIGRKLVVWIIGRPVQLWLCSNPAHLPPHCKLLALADYPDSLPVDKLSHSLLEQLNLELNVAETGSQFFLSESFREEVESLLASLPPSSLLPDT